MRYVTILETITGTQTTKRVLASGSNELCNETLKIYLKNNTNNNNERVYVTAEKEHLKEITPVSGKQILMEQ